MPGGERIKLSNNSTPSQSVKMVDAVGSYKKNNSKAECNCFGGHSEDVIWFFDLKCQCTNNDSKKAVRGDSK